ncbi:hypothetical protein L9F63_023090 [Diploptera punctata]|uniref:Cytochrome P450 n=1 Tax=Diploptera punctata TaxID=6984 RepID=A0AAD7ZJW2_DIPPU|nr:hypothetical protein L9F63_023090 [Diploptera punctata]
MGQTYAQIYRDMKDAGFLGVYMGHRPVLVLKDPELIKNFLVKDFDHFHDHGFVFDEKVDPLLANLFMLTGKKWKDLRADLSKTFTSGKIKRMFGKTVECSQELVEYLKIAADVQDTIEAKDVMVKFTTDIIASCAFGIQCYCFKNPNSEFMKYGKRMQQLTYLDNLKGLLYLTFPKLAIYLGIPLTDTSVAKFFRGAVKEIVDFRMESKERRNDFIELLLELMEEQTFQGKIFNFIVLSFISISSVYISIPKYRID